MQGAMQEPAKPAAPEFDMASLKEQIKRELMGHLQEEQSRAKQDAKQEPIKKVEEPKKDVKQEPTKVIEELTMAKPKELEVSSEYLRKRALLSTYLSKRR